MDGWYTKEDVKKDLAVNGLGANMNDDDDSYIIDGARPPPPPRHLTEEDDMMQQYILNGTFASGDRCSEWTMKPDLNGITKCIRQVDAANTKSDRVKKPEETCIVISKLNPLVPEFKPKQDINDNNTTTNEIKEENEASEDFNSCEKEESCIKKVETNKETKQYCNVNDDDDKLETILKEKIKEAKTMNEKKKKNVAIQALLKLKSGPPKSPLTTCSSESQTPRLRSLAPMDEKKTLVLHPPNFYESKFNDAQVDSAISMPDSTKSDNGSNKKYQSKKESEQAIKSNLEPAEGAIAVVNPLEHESIQKVENWLNGPEKPSPAEPLHIGPISFKKKDPAPLTVPVILYKKKESKESPKSSDSKSPVSDEARKKPSQPGAFVPSKYAYDLAKKYEERAKANEDKQLDMWAKLEKDLKARDEVVKERLKAQNGSSPNSSQGNSRCPSRRQ